MSETIGQLVSDRWPSTAWARALQAQPVTLDKSSARIRQMFAQIAGRYDLLNHLLSLGIDRRWRRRTVRLAPPDGETKWILDLCTGTADLALAYGRASGPGVRIIGADFCRPMLAIARDKCRRVGAAGQIALVEADALQLPFGDDRFDIVCVAFGLRNVSNLDGGLREMVRVCRPGGRVAVLEFPPPGAGCWGPSMTGTFAASCPGWARPWLKIARELIITFQPVWASSPRVKRCWNECAKPGLGTYAAIHSRWAFARCTPAASCRDEVDTTTCSTSYFGTARERMCPR